jgi:ribosomal protein S18 acetylase RimI-like enzyme
VSGTAGPRGQSGIQTRPLLGPDREWLRTTLKERWGDDSFAGRGRVRQLDELAALVAVDGDERVGVATYLIEGTTAELVTLDALRTGTGVGRLLVEAVIVEARRRGARRLLAMTTNDNVAALRFYQRAGFRLVELRPGAVYDARALKPTIPDIGHDGIPIRDELDLVRLL